MNCIKKISMCGVLLVICAMPSAQAMNRTTDIPVRVASAGVALVGVKLMLGSSTKLRSVARCALGAALTVGGVIGALYGQDTGAVVHEFVDDAGTGMRMLQDLMYKWYYGAKRNYTDAVQDHGWYYWYTGKHKLNQKLVEHKLDRYMNR